MTRPDERALPLCVVCRHLHRHGTGRVGCDAYPLGIPGSVLDGRVAHREPLCGDGGVLFEPAPEVPAFLVEMVSQGLTLATSRR
jgi:hypothetical protein